MSRPNIFRDKTACLNNKWHTNLLNLLVTMFKEQLPMMECSYVVSGLFFVICSPFEFISAYY